MISVCIPTYNGEKYILPQVQSILKQLSKEDEIIISDDNSSDNTVELLQSLSDKRIKIYHHSPTNQKLYKGVLRNVYLINRNLENALSKAVGDIIFIADQDDIWLDNKVEKVIAELTNADLILHNCTVVDSNLEILRKSFFDIISPRISILSILYHTSFMGCCMAFNRRIKEHALPFPNYAVEHDTWIGMCSLKYGKIRIIHTPLILYRRHSNNISPCYDGSTNSLYVRIKRRILILKAYSSLFRR